MRNGHSRLIGAGLVLGAIFFLVQVASAYDFGARVVGNQVEVTTAGGLRLQKTPVSATAAELNTTDVSAAGAALKVAKYAIAANPTGAEQDTGLDLPAKAIVVQVCVSVTTAEATGTTKTLDVGTDGSGSNDPDGFLDGVSVATTGLKCGAFNSTTGSNNTYVGAASTHTRGALLTERLIAGEDVAAGGDGVAVPGWDVTSGGESITFTAGSNNFAELRGTILVFYYEVA